ncbi:hypothetical protein GA0070215_11478 [Micromonospora marina]|uniref:Uncharacterized protein n=1 Tax=Micromonospora marina TaxID=307120 RepID=A0A1C4Z3J1_9ACTN|nr:hypothetical protein GA0070215_11478 [Micromonospora marina]
MWACVQDQDTAGQWKQVAGWRKVCDLALAHLSRLREYRRGLAEAWPPETNTAARAYIAELDQLIDRVQRTHDAAAANYDALAAAARAIGSARAELQPLHEEYAKKLRQKQAYEATIADPKAVAGSRLPERPPVTDDDLEQLNIRARGLMTGLSGELQHAQVMLQRPPTPIRPGRQINDPDAYGEAPPIIPPVVPVQVPTSARRSLAKPSTMSSSAAKPATTPSSNVGPILGGAGPGPAPATPLAPSPPINQAPQHTPGVGGQIGIPSTANLGRHPFNRSTIAAQPHLPTNDVGTSRPPLGGTGRQALPNGFVGVPPSQGISQPPPSAPRRVNPVGGVIGGGGAGTAPSGAAGSRPGSGRTIQPGIGHSPFPIGGSPSASATSHSRSRRDPDSECGPVWDADHPWETNQGVDPVMRPPDDGGPIDPGPAIGFNR